MGRFAWAAWCWVSVASAAWAGPPATWESRGPGGGGAMYAPSINPHDPDELYVACDMSPQFRTGDFGKTWATVNFQQLQSNKFSAVRFTKDSKTLWTLNYASPAGRDCVRPCVSRDGGRTWELPSAQAWPDDRQGFAMVADFEHPDRVFMTADYRELWATLDGGRTWERKFTTPDKAAGLVLGGIFVDGDAVYLGTNAGVLASTDGGRTFAVAPFAGIAPGEVIISMAGAGKDGRQRLVCVTAAKAFAGQTGAEHAGYRGVYVADPKARQWVRRTSGITEPNHPFFVAMAAGDPQTVYLGGGSSGPKPAPIVYKSSDGGETWAEVFHTDNNRNIVVGWEGHGGQFDWSWPEYVLGMDVCPTDPDRVVITDLGTVHATADGGRTWRVISTRPNQARVPNRPTPKTGRFTGNGIEPTACWTLTWLTADTLFAGFSDIKGCRSVDSGKTWGWDYTGHALNAAYSIVKHPKTGVCYLANSSVHDMYRSRYLTDAALDKGQGGVMSSTDDGATWKPMHDFKSPTVWLALDPNKPNRLLASVVDSKDGGLYVTDDAPKGPAATWRRLAAPPRTQGHPLSVYVCGDGAIVATFCGRRQASGFTPSSGFFVSTDDGKTWQDRSHPAMRYWTKDAVPDPTDPKGDTWYVGVAMAWGKTEPAAKNSGLYRTLDRGKTWTQIAGNDTVPSGVCNVDSARVNPDDPDELYFTTEYDGLFHTANAKAAAPAFTQVKNFPFRDTTRVFFNPFIKGEVWVLTFGNGLYVGQSTPTK